eukprot:gnl/MRDRNA2_/MRDRNA2_97685_c0_seq1.p1 gnl/MRDRNA2_/MRDRNA2_97685_c0~~gnl/MRDRNA2_/MRDRNA2_97685_c0_seq1.p1  ORF type:complete len:539 (+),score=35.81 gnl/MRDRNA2_/MRDRNA2_97685_c0_seq1:172-1617(+)
MTGAHTSNLEQTNTTSIFEDGNSRGTAKTFFFPPESPLATHEILQASSPVSLNQTPQKGDGTDAWWWRDNVIIGRLSALARRYWSLRMCARPFRAWTQYTQTKVMKKESSRKQQIEVVISMWRCRALHRFYWRELPLVRVLTQTLCRAGLRSAWTRLQSWACSWRSVMQRATLLRLMRLKMMNSIAVCHHIRSLYQRGLGGFWICAKQVQPSRGHSHTSRASGSQSVNCMYGSENENRGVLLRVQSRTWQRWRHATRSWCIQERYRQQNHQHAMLWLLRNKALNSIAMCHRVWVLQSRGFEGLAWQLWVASDGRKNRGIPPQKLIVNTPQRNRPNPYDVKRKVLSRWRFTVTVEDPIPEHPEWVSSSLSSLQHEIASITNYDNSKVGSDSFMRDVPFPNLPEDRRILLSSNFPPWATEPYKRVDKWSDAYGPLDGRSDVRTKGQTKQVAQTNENSLPLWVVSAASRKDTQMLSCSPKRPAG